MYMHFSSTNVKKTNFVLHYARTMPRNSSKSKTAKEATSKNVQFKKRKHTKEFNESEDCAKSFKKDPEESQSNASSSTKTAEILKTDNRLTQGFYNQDCESLSKELLGTKIVRKLENGELLTALIVETEAYLGGDDKAAHSYNGKRTPKNEAMFMPPGTAYVYHIYGVLTCLNISSKGEGAAVLLRAVEPLQGIETMKIKRCAKKPEKVKTMKEKEVGNGPSKLTQALQIDKPGINKQSLIDFTQLWLEPGPKEISKDSIVASARIGIDYAEEWAKKPLRFYIKDNVHVSKRDKKAEKNMVK